MNNLSLMLFEGMANAGLQADAIFLVMTDDLPWYKRWFVRRLARRARKKAVKAIAKLMREKRDEMDAAEEAEETTSKMLVDLSGSSQSD